MRRFLRSCVADLGLALGVFVLANVVGELARPPFDATHAWIGAPRGWGWLIGKAVLAVLLVAHAARPLAGAARLALLALLGGLAAVAVVDTFVYFDLVARGAITTSLPLPGSIAVLLVTLALTLEVRRPAPRARGVGRLATLAGAAAAVTIGLPLLLMLTFGPTNYAREADCIVVFGARVYADGRPSDALADRVDEAVQLYHAGVAPVIVMSGARDEGHGGSEPAAMKARAVAAGVPAAAIVLDEAGVDTAATVRETATWAEPRGVRRVVAVSHYYHLPRVKLLFERAGLRAYTVPATMKRRLLKEPYFVAREVLAYYDAFLRE